MHKIWSSFHFNVVLQTTVFMYYEMKFRKCCDFSERSVTVLWFFVLFLFLFIYSLYNIAIIISDNMCSQCICICTYVNSACNVRRCDILPVYIIIEKRILFLFFLFRDPLIHSVFYLFFFFFARSPPPPQDDDVSQSNFQQPDGKLYTQKHGAHIVAERELLEIVKEIKKKKRQHHHRFLNPSKDIK